MSVIVYCDFFGSNCGKNMFNVKFFFHLYPTIETVLIKCIDYLKKKPFTKKIKVVINYLLLERLTYIEK